MLMIIISSLSILLLYMFLQTAQKYSDHPEKRSPVAMEIVSSEVEYNRLLAAVKNVYFRPLNAALRSNRSVWFYGT